MPSPRDREARGYRRQRINHPLQPGDPGSETWDWEWAKDPCAQTILRVYGRGMRLEEIGEWMGVSRERVRQIEAKAVEKIKRAYQQGKITRDEIEALVPEWRWG